MHKPVPWDKHDEFHNKGAIRDVVVGYFAEIADDFVAPHVLVFNKEFKNHHHKEIALKHDLLLIIFLDLLMAVVIVWR